MKTKNVKDLISYGKLGTIKVIGSSEIFKDLGDLNEYIIERKISHSNIINIEHRYPGLQLWYFMEEQLCQNQFGQNL